MDIREEIENKIKNSAIPEILGDGMIKGYSLVFGDDYIIKSSDVYVSLTDMTKCWFYVTHKRMAGLTYREALNKFNNIVVARRGRPAPSPKRFPDERPYPYGY